MAMGREAGGSKMWQRSSTGDRGVGGWGEGVGEGEGDEAAIGAEGEREDDAAERGPPSSSDAR